jgi:four helix bundle protein
MRDFRDTKVWLESRHLVLAVYEVTLGFSKDNDRGLRGLIRRAAVSIPANIARCLESRDPVRSARYLRSTLSSIRQLEEYLLTARDMGLLETPIYDKVVHECDEVKSLVSSFADRRVAGS